MDCESVPEKRHQAKRKPRGRHSIRFPKYDYAQPGAYFVTICTHHQLPILGRISEGEIALSQEGIIVKKCLVKIPHHFTSSSLDAYVIMPNHVHAIIILTDNRRGEASAKDSGFLPFESKADASPLQPKDSRPRGTKSGSLGAIIQNFKFVSTRKMNQFRNTPGDRIWQRNYFEHIIRSEKALNAIRRYIMTNPVRWEMDRYNPKAPGIDNEANDLWNMLREDAISKRVER